MKLHHNQAVRLGAQLDAALDRHEAPERICKQLRTMGDQAREVFASMLNAGRIFSGEFWFQCNNADRRLIYDLSDEMPELIGDNYFYQIDGLGLIAARQQASVMRGRVNLSMREPFSDGARYEIHRIFSRKDTVEGYAESLASLPNLGANDLATTIWAGRIYQRDLFQAAPQRLKLKLLEHLHRADPVIAQPFVTQIVSDCQLSRRYRVLAWSEGVLRPHREYPITHPAIKRAYAASAGARKECGDIGWQYAGGDHPARFDIERTLHGFKLSRRLIVWLCQHSYQNVLVHYLTNQRQEFERAFPLPEFAGYVCADAKCGCAIPLLEVVEKLSPGLLARFHGRNGAGLLEYALYRARDRRPQRGSWLRMCLDGKSDLRPLVAFLRQRGCRNAVPNDLGLTWADIEDATLERFDGCIFKE